VTRIRAGRPGIDPWQGGRRDIVLFATLSKPAVGPTQPPLQLVPGGSGVKRPRSESDHTPTSSAKTNDEWSYTSTPQYVFMAWCLVTHRDNFNLFYLYNRSGFQATVLTSVRKISHNLL